MSICDRESTARETRLLLLGACGLIAALLTSAPLKAQEQTQQASPVRAPSDLARRNLAQVGASAPEIKAVLIQDAGLMVELKRWVAKDATEHGQMLEGSDLTDDAIFDRLEKDAEFRSVATRLVQQYGYLVPSVNPDSQLGKERQLLVQERVKWIAQYEEEERSQQAKKEQEKYQKTRACDPDAELNCRETYPARRENQLEPEEEELPFPPSRVNPSQPGPSNVPANGAQLQRAELTEPNTDTSDDILGLSPGSTDSLGDVNQLRNGISPGIPRQSIENGAGEGVSAATLQQMRAQAQPGDNDGALLGALGSGGAGSVNLESAMAGSVGGMNEFGNSKSSIEEQMNPFGTQESLWSSSSRAMMRGLRRPNQRAMSQPAEMVRAANPFNDVPSLYDMYLQARPHPAAVRRFGIDVFENGTRDPRLIPMDLPVGPDYVVGPGDALAIDLWGGVSRRLYRTVDREGRVSLPEVGPVLVNGKSLADVQENLQQTLRTQFRDVSAAVSLSRLRTIRIYEVGDVANPGAYDVSSLSTPLNALFEAGGPTPRGSLRIVKHYRGSELVQTVDLYDLLLHGVKSGIERLENGDSVLVPPIGPQVVVEGMVRRPAIYELKDEKNLASVLELAGGLLPAATLRHIEVQRLVAHEKQTMLNLDIPESDGDAEVTKKLESFTIQDGDRIRVYPIAPYNQDAIYLQGHVLRPGRYSYRQGMRVTDLISSYKDLLPEPASQYAEIIRLNAPDFRPTVQSFDLAEALANPEQAPELHAMDTVRIFSRYDFQNAPSVSVFGDVRAPGTYRTSGQIHLSDAVHLAGGLTPDAEKEDAQVFRYLPDGKMKIFSVSLSRALEGDPSANILLEERDRLLVHRNPDAVEPAVVYVQGEVGKPGRYPLTTNMTVADLIRVGGGLKPSADTQSADLTRYTWKTSPAGAATQVSADHENVPIADALSANSDLNQPLRNGDVLTIRQLPGWNDLGASITVRGEVRHPGTYGIRPGERLSSILERAGGFQPDAYPYGAILQRVEVREIEAQQQDAMILRVKDVKKNIEALPDTDPKQKEQKEMAVAQWQTTLEQLSTNPPVGRVDIRITSDIRRWQNTTSDVAIRAGDTLTVPKRPSYVMVTGQVFNPTAVSYRPGKSAKWYLSQSGGPTPMANKKAIFVIRADGSVIGDRKSLWIGESLSAALQPGDTVVVPERAAPIAGVQWQTVFSAGQLASAVATTVFFALRY